MPVRRRKAGIVALPPTDALALIRVLVDALSRSARAIATRTGITNAQLFFLQQLADADGLSVKELAERARTQHSSASIVIARLVRAGVVRKATSRSDGRRVVLTLTPKGRRVLVGAPDPPTATLLSALERVRPSDASALALGLRALVRELGLKTHSPAMLFEPPPAHQSRGTNIRRKAASRA